MNLSGAGSWLVSETGTKWLSSIKYSLAYVTLKLLLLLHVSLMENAILRLRSECLIMKAVSSPQ